MVLFGLQLPRLLVPAGPEMATAESAGRAAVASIALRSGALGLEWTSGEMSGWTDARLPDSDSNPVRVAGARLFAPMSGTPLAKGAGAVFHFRLVAPAGPPVREAGR
jgi:hypothetical protein